jgi:hypothetical protein
LGTFLAKNVLRLLVQKIRNKRPKNELLTPGKYKEMGTQNDAKKVCQYCGKIKEFAIGMCNFCHRFPNNPVQIIKKSQEVIKKSEKNIKKS